MSKRYFTSKETEQMKKGTLHDRMTMFIVESNDEIKDGISEIKQSNIKIANRIDNVEIRTQSIKDDVDKMKDNYDNCSARDFFDTGNKIFIGGKKLWMIGGIHK